MSVNKEDRVFVAKLLRSVRIGNCGVREALMQYPRDTDDESLIAVYHALIHYEADEDLRRRDALYKEEQDDYIESLSYILEKGEDLPQNIIDNYKKYYDTVPILHKKDIRGFLKSFFKILNIGRKKDK